jgi:hypothetical protein
MIHDEADTNTQTNTSYYSKPHSRRCSCNRMSWMALNTTRREGIPSAKRQKCGFEGCEMLTFDLLGVCGTCIMCIYLLGRRALVQRYEPMKEVVACCIVTVPTRIIWEVVTERRAREFFGE